MSNQTNKILFTQHCHFFSLSFSTMTNLRNMVMSSKFKGFQKTRESRKQTDAALRIKAPPTKRISHAELVLRAEAQELAEWTHRERKVAEVFHREDYANDEVGVNQCTVEKTENSLDLDCAGSKCNLEIENLLALHNVAVIGLILRIKNWNGRNYETFYGLDFYIIIFVNCDIRNLDLLHLGSPLYVHLHNCPKLTTTGYAFLNKTSRLWNLTLSGICDNDLTNLCNVPHIKISHSFITDNGIMYLKDVRTLVLDHCPFVSPNGFDCLSQCIHLRIEQCSRISIRPKNPVLNSVVIDGVDFD